MRSSSISIYIQKSIDKFTVFKFTLIPVCDLYASTPSSVYDKYDMGYITETYTLQWQAKHSGKQWISSIIIYYDNSQK